MSTQDPSAPEPAPQAGDGGRAGPRPSVVLCSGGPMLLRGAASVEDEQGAVHPITRPVAAVCRCGRTARAPWCDGTHGLLPDHERPR